MKLTHSYPAGVTLTGTTQEQRVGHILRKTEMGWKWNGKAEQWEMANSRHRAPDWRFTHTEAALRQAGFDVDVSSAVATRGMRKNRFVPGTEAPAKGHEAEFIAQMRADIQSHNAEINQSAGVEM